MRKTLISSLAILMVTACARDANGPTEYEDSDLALVEFGGLAYGIGSPQPAAGTPELRRLKALPGPIALTAEQEATITGLIDDFQKTYEADIAKLAELLTKAKEAIAAGKTRQEVAAIFAEARPLRVKLAEATAKLHQDIQNVLTDAQKAWLASGSPNRCYPTVVAPLSAEQKTAIQALYAAYNEATKADREVVAATMKAVREARAANKPREEIQAMLADIKDEMERLQAAGTKLRADIDAVLTPEQKAAGCFGPAPRPRS